MPARNDHFPWMSYYENYGFFETRMREHSKVLNMQNNADGLYGITLIDGRVLTVFICECYAFGAAEYYEVTQEHGEIDAVVISSNWCSQGYGLNVDYRDGSLGVFSIRDFMSVLNRGNFRDYYEEADECPF